MKITNEIKRRLLGPDGSLTEPGWATKLIFEYSPFDVKANKMRIKEWDYYVIADENGAFSTVIADNRYMGLANASYYDFKEQKKYDFITPLIMPKGKLNMPTDSSTGDIYYKDRYCSLAYIHEKDGRRLVGKYQKCSIHDEMEFDIFLEKNPDDTMVIATPWDEDKTAFYYNQKINCMPAKGYLKFGGRTIEFSPEKHFATLDWGRGVWTYDNTWYWGTGNGFINNKRFGYNIGYGFGNTSAASENMIFYDGKCHKFDRIEFVIPEDDTKKPWKFISSDGRFDMKFIPVFETITDMGVLFIRQNANKVFGKLTGKAILDDGTALEIKDMIAFAERVRNRY